MNKALPWNVNGIGFEAREAAHIAARRAGVPVGEWLNTVITEHASGIGLTPDSFSADDRLDSLVARLAGVAESLSDDENRQSRSDKARHRASSTTAAGTASMSRATNEEDLLSDKESSALPSRRARNSESTTAALDKGYLAEWDNEVLLDEALELIGKRVADKDDRRTEQQRMTVAALASEAEGLGHFETDPVASASRYRAAKASGSRRERRPVRDAVGVVAERIEEIESRIAQRDADLAARPIVAALGRLENRFEHLIRRNADGSREDARFETGFRDLDSRLRELAERIDRKEPSRARASAEADRESALSSALSRLDAADGRRRTDTDHEAISHQRAGLRNRAAVAEIAQRQMDLDAGQVRRSGLMRGTSHPTIDQARREPASPSSTSASTDAGELEQFGPFSALQDAFAKLTERLEARLDAQARAASLDDRTADIGALKTGIAELGERLETFKKRDDEERAERAGGQPIEMLRQEITALQNGLSSLAPRSAIATLETAVRELGGQLDTSQRAGVNSNVLAPIQALQEEVRAVLQDDRLRTKVGHVEEQLQSLADSMETAQAYSLGADTLQVLSEQTRQLHELFGGAALQFKAVERLEGEISHLSTRVEKLIEGPPRGAVRDLELAVNEIRTLLVQFSPETALYDVSRQLDGLADRMGLLEEAIPASAAIIDDFGRRIDDAHAALAERLLKAAPVVDLTQIEESIGGLSNKIDGLRSSSTDMQALGGLVRGLAAQIEEARLPSADAKVIDTLETQVSRLAERLDHSDASLEAISSVERLIRELFSQIDETRSTTIEAAESAARIAAKETLRSALASPAAGGEEASARATLVVEQVGQEISEFRKAQQVSEKRVHSTLIALNETLERMVDRMVVEGGAPTGAASHHVVAIEAPDGVGPVALRRGPDASEGAKAPPLSVALPSASEPVLPETGREPPSVTPVAPAIEVGRAPAAEPMPDVSPLIAAARRAAQVAQTSAAATGKEGGQKGIRLQPQTQSSKGWRTIFGQKRKPMLLSIASVLLLLGALQIVRIAQGERHTASADKTDTVAQTSKVDAPNSVAAAPVAPVVGSPAQLAQADLTPQPQASLPSATALVASAPKALPAGLRDLADRGDPAAQYEVGARLAEGRGITRDADAAAGWFERSAQQNFAPAEYRLGSLYEKGIGVSPAPAQAITWYEKAANHGNVRAMHNLAVMAAEGPAGKPDYVRAASWFSKAAEHGVRDSQYNLAILYARGLGLTQDLGQSYTWFSIAAAQGDTDAGKKRDDVAVKIEAAKLTVAKAAVDSFKPQPTDKAANEVSPPPGGWDVVASGKGVPASPKLSSM